MSETANAPRPDFIRPDLDPLWMPFTHNRYFKQHPRLVVAAEGVHYTSEDGREIIDALSGLWCCNAGHRHPKIIEAVKAQLDVLDYAVAFQAHHPKAFELAEKLCAAAPAPFRHAFFTNSGSEACDTALKIALAYHKARGDGSRFRLIGREKGYHGVGFGGQPAWGAHLADDLARLIALHDASTIAAVIIEPMQGSAGVIVPPLGYLERVRELCTAHGIVLIFDEVITGFGRLGEIFSPDRFGVMPDLITFAKGVTSGMIPLGGVLATAEIYDAFMQGPEHLVEFFHGYTYSGHPIAAAAGIAAIDVYESEDLFARARALEPVLERAVHALRGERHIVDIRNCGLAAAFELEPRPGAPSLRAMDVFHRCYDNGVMVRYAGDVIAIGPPLTISERQITQIVEIIRDAVRAVD